MGFVTVEYPIPIAIGYDPREAIAYHVCCQSILEHASVPVSFIPLALNTLKGYEETHGDGSNAFIYSRFLVPWMMGWKGCAIYMDGDMIVRGDIKELWDMRRHDVGVQVVKHEYRTKFAQKYLGAVNEDYPMKNWSSVMLWSCSFLENRKLTPEFVAQQDGAFLHRFEWLSPARVGTLPARMNHLCMEYPPNDDALIYHYTVGTPCFGGEYADQEGGGEWQRTLRNALAPLGGPAAIG
jgi:hypothetical protein